MNYILDMTYILGQISVLKTQTRSQRPIPPPPPPPICYMKKEHESTDL